MKPYKFLKTIWTIQANNRKCYFCISTKAVRNGKWRDHLFSWPKQKADIKSFLEDNATEDYDLYFCPLPFKIRRRSVEAVLDSRLLWADLDEANPRGCDPVPQIAWRSSPKRFASLWMMNKHLPPKQLEPMNRAMTYACGADKGGWDLTQVLRLPGTLNHKYPERPRGKLLWFKDNEYPISKFPDESAISEVDPNKLYQQVKHKIKAKTKKLLMAKKATQGKRSEVIWKLENDLSEQGLSKEQIFTLIKHSVWNKFAGRRDEDKQLQRELNKIEAKPERPKLSDTSQETSSAICLADVAPEKVDWLWHPYIPRGKLTVMEGDPGLGKSWLTMALAACLSTNKKLPGQTKATSGGRVLLLSAEDGLGDTIRPRLDDMKANVKKIFAINKAIVFDDEGIEEVRAHIDKIQPTMVIVDPLVAYMGGGVDLHKANEVRVVMHALGSIAEDYGLSILAVRHLTKGSRDKSIYRGQGSVDITAAARSVLAVGYHPEHDDLRVICHIKSNLAMQGQSVQYALTPNRDNIFSWQGFCDVTVEDMQNTSANATGNSQKKLAREFLEEQLHDGPVRKQTLKKNAEAKGIKWDIINLIKSELAIVIKPIKGKYFWSLNKQEES
jgi:RecA-family ATPase